MYKKSVLYIKYTETIKDITVKNVYSTKKVFKEIWSAIRYTFVINYIDVLYFFMAYV